MDIVDQLDRRSLTGRYGGRGGSQAWHPAMMVSLLLSGYATGTFSSRKREQATRDRVPYRYLCANQPPDEESQIMAGSGGGFEQSYNAQARVDINSGLIITGHITPQSNDKRRVDPTLAQLAQRAEVLGLPTGLLADTGYFGAANVKAIAAQGIAPVIATGRQAHHPPLAERRVAAPDEVEPSGEPVEDMRRTLRTATGQALYARRKSTIEPTFGVIKHVQGFRQFLLRGVDAVRGAWDLVCMAFNVKKLHALRA